MADWTLASYSYNATSSLLESETYGNKSKVEYTYDRLGRVKTVTYKEPNGTVSRVLTYTYTGDGQLHSVYDSQTGKTSRYMYDTLGRLIQSQNEDVRTAVTYNSYNQLTKWGYSSKLDNAYETYTYDTAKDNSISDGTMTAMRTLSGDTLNYTYDNLQRLTDKYISGKVWERYAYSGTRVTNKTNWMGNAKIQDYVYAYDTLGNILSERDTLTGNSVTYTYDRMGQLTGAVQKNSAGTTARTESYTYDNAGNIKTFSNGKKSLTLSYSNGQWKDLLTAVNGKELVYDKLGNPLTYYNGSALAYTFTWTEGRNLKTYTYNGETTTYSYNADGLRTKKTNPDGSYIEYLIADGRYLGEIHYTATHAVDRYMRYNYDESGSVMGISLWDANVSTQWTDFYFLKNLQGDVLKVYRSDGVLAASYSYDSWGNIVDISGSVTFDTVALKDLNPFRYRSYYYDSETWFYYLQSRYYDPAIGRFISADDADLLGVNGDVASLNLFAYCGNNPIIRADNGGQFWHIIVGAVVGAVSQYVSDVVSSLASGASFAEALVPTSSLVDYLAASASGALAATGVGAFGAAVGNAAIDGTAYVVNCGINGEEVDTTELLITVGSSALTSRKGVNGKKLRGVYKRSNQVLETAVSAKKRSMYRAKKAEVISTVTKGVREQLTDGTNDGIKRGVEKRLGR